MIDTLQIQIPSIPENIRIVESFIDNVKDRYELDDDIYGNIMIAVTESVNNAISHGNGNQQSKNVTLKLILDDSAIRFQISDEGLGFDPQHLPDPTAPENLSNPGGRGIFLMKHLCDEVVFRNQGREVELAFYL